ncbi:MAG: MFS transporter [Chloroflexi bacterium]|nr:MFS transporter [Chloroflexota bacterium]
MARAAGQETGFPWLSIAGCIGGNFLLRSASSAALSLVSLSLAHIDSTTQEVPATFLGLTAVAFYSTELVFSPIFGSLSDRYGRQTFMRLSGVLGAGGVGVLTFASALPVFLLAKVAQGLSTASSVPSVLGYLAVATSRSDALRGRTMVVFESVTVLGFAMGFTLGGLLWDRLHASAFPLVALVYLLASAAFLLVQDNGASVPRKRGWQFYRTVLRHVPTLSFAPSWICVNAILGLWFIHLGFQMAQMDNPAQLLVGGFSGSAIGLVTGGVALVLVLGTGAWALAFGRVRTTTIMAGALLALALFCLVLYRLNHTPKDAVTQIAILTVVIVLILLAVSGFTPAALAYLAELSEQFPENRGGMMGLYSVFLGVGQLLGGWLGGFFAEAWGVDGLILVTALLGLAANASLYLITRAPGARKPASQTAALP